MTSFLFPPGREEVRRVADIASREILEGYSALSGQHWSDEGNPISRTLEVEALVGFPYSDVLANALSESKSSKMTWHYSPFNV